MTKRMQDEVEREARRIEGGVANGPRSDNLELTAEPGFKQKRHEVQRYSGMAHKRKRLRTMDSFTPK